jgi:glycosyltransferase involved in cell wall biosynthesis
MVYDLDDALFLHAPFQIDSLVRLSDVVVAGGHELATYARRLNPRTVLIPSCANIAMYRQVDRPRREEGLVLGFVGSPSTIRYLSLLMNPLETLAKHHDYTLRIVAARSKEEYEKFDRLLGGLGDGNIRVETALYSVRNEPAVLSGIDIGLAPMTKTIWDSYKCGFKVINYMSAGVPPVATDWGEHAHIITDGYDGFLCRNEQDWVVKLGVLMECAEKRRIMAENARRTAERNYSSENHFRTMARIIRKL